MMTRPVVSVIVTTKNSAATLPALFESCRQQVFQHFELIVVDNYSTDSTLQVARQYTDIIFCQGPERSAQRNYGVAQDNGDYVLILDSDMELAPTVLQQCIASMENDSTLSGLIIPEKSFGEGFWAQCKALERSCYLEDYTIQAARFFRKDSFLAVGGYDEELAGCEDWDLSQRLGSIGPVGAVNAWIRHNEGRLSVLGTMRKKAYYARYFGLYQRKHPHQASKQGNLLLRRAYFRNSRRLISTPHLLAGMMVLRTCEMVAAITGYAVSQLSAGHWVGNKRRNADNRIDGHGG